MEQAHYVNYFFDANFPFADCERLKAFIAEQFGFDKACVNVLRSTDGHLCYPLFQDKSNNYLVFTVKGYTYSCINGDLRLMDGRR